MPTGVSRCEEGMDVNPNHKDQSHPSPSNQVLNARTPPAIPDSLSTLLHRLYP